MNQLAQQQDEPGRQSRMSPVPRTSSPGVWYADETAATGRTAGPSGQRQAMPNTVARVARRPSIMDVALPRIPRRSTPRPTLNI